ncbi:MAG: hypothetical protein CVV22_06310 [Ignavibacteriae bacterium HGW-Ignavibacteriae-1]|jgi:hypothetical protein|nr:MAG: hypothetical protein CVV22_06310 [Ignavibacteriae bacterium HGW-Ignavibacteriae-1]
MYGLKELKSHIIIEEHSVECPVKGCSIKVERQRQSFKREQKFQCSEHKIYISPSTFEYQTAKENLLWYDNSDKILFNKILEVKRECRIARENSEDALTWNVMRFLDRQKLLPSFLSQLSRREIQEAEMILWSYSPTAKSSWSLLNQARIEFGETVARGSEPDIIILTDKVLYFIEAKLTSKNKTKPSNLQNRKKYEIGGNKWFQHIFKSDFETLTVREQQYELMRYWLLGSWLAKQIGIDFEFYSLVIQSREKALEAEFDKNIIETPERKFSRLTWEQIYDFVITIPESQEKQKITEYFINKTIGYGSNGKIIKAFEL